MGKTSTWLWCAVVLVNPGAGVILRYTCTSMAKSYVDLLVGAALPSITERVLAVPWWPYCVFGLALIAALVTARMETKKELTSAVLVGDLLTRKRIEHVSRHSTNELTIVHGV